MKKKYFIKIPCVNGHICERYVSNDMCVECRKIWNTSYKRTKRCKLAQKKYAQSDKGKQALKRYNHSDKGKATHKKFRQSTKGKSLYRKANKSPAHKKALAKYALSPKGKDSFRRARHKRRALKLNLIVVPYTANQHTERFKLFGNKCVYCGSKKDLTDDHFIPLASGGSHTLTNIVPACRTCNSWKWTFDAVTWFKQQTFFSQKRLNNILIKLPT